MPQRFVLQIVPVVTGVQVLSGERRTAVSAQVVIITGRGFVEGRQQRVPLRQRGERSLVLLDAGASTRGRRCSRYTTRRIGQYVNGQVTLTVPLADGVFGADQRQDGGRARVRATALSLSGVTARWR